MMMWVSLGSVWQAVTRTWVDDMKLDCQWRWEVSGLRTLVKMIIGLVEVSTGGTFGVVLGRAPKEDRTGREEQET